MNDKIRISTSNYAENIELSSNFFTNSATESFKKVVELNSMNLSVEQKQLLINSISNRTYYNDDSDYKIAKNYNGIKIEFNPNKVMKKSLLDSEPIGYNEMITCFDIVEQKLLKIGIFVNLKSEPIYSNHNSFDVLPSCSYSVYEPIIKLTTNDKISMRNSDKNYFENTLYLGSKSNKIVVYDKQTESAEQLPNMIRFEHRFEKINKPKRYSMSHLTESAYFNQRLQAKKLIHRNIFSYDSKRLNNDDDGLMLLQTMFNQSYKNNDIFKHFFATVIHSELIKKGLSIRDILPIKSDNRKDYQRLVRIETAINEFKQLPIKYKDYYNELKQLFQKVA